MLLKSLQRCVNRYKAYACNESGSDILSQTHDKRLRASSQNYVLSRSCCFSIEMLPIVTTLHRQMRSELNYCHNLSPVACLEASHIAYWISRRGASFQMVERPKRRRKRCQTVKCFKLITSTPKWRDIFSYESSQRAAARQWVPRAQKWRGSSRYTNICQKQQFTIQKTL